MQAQVLNLLKEMQERMRLACLFISHDLSLVNSLCERVLVMKDGYIVESGTTADVFNEPKEEYTQKLIAAIPKIDRDLIYKNE